MVLSTPQDVNRMLADARLVCLDFETTGLNPRRDRVRLMTLTDGQRILTIDCFEHPLQQFLPTLSKRILVAHNALFELSFLWNAGLRDLPETVCTYLLAQLVTAGEGERGFGSCGLAACCQRWLGRTLSKELQTSNWSGSLSTEQLEYAAADVDVLPPLLRALTAELEKAHLVQVSEIELQCLPAWVWLSQSGTPFDPTAWLALAEQAHNEKKRLADQLDALAPIKGIPGLFGPVEAWNWDSPQQVMEVLGHLGYDVTSTRDAQLALIPGEFAAAMRQHREQAQLLKMYGPSWLQGAEVRDGRVYPDWRQIGTVTGRTACKTPNCQQIPRAAGYRTCFKAPSGRVLVKADFSQLQMRLACRWAQDTALYQVFAGKQDTHTQTAKNLTGKETPSKVERQIAKSANFLLTFAGSAEALRIYCSTNFGLMLTEEEARKHRNAFFAAYPGLKAWHNRAFQSKSTEIRSRLGRRRLVPSNVVPTERVNTPCQADESDGAKIALGRLWRERASHPGAKLVLFNHDEIVLECDQEHAEEVSDWLRQSMLGAMQPVLDPVPCEVECSVVPSWGG